MSEANPHDIIVGVDTHKHTHAAVAVTGLGARVGELTIRVGLGGYRELEAWARSLGAVRAFGIEGTGSYGAGLARFLRAAGHTVHEVGPSRSRAAPPAWQDGPPRCRRRRPRRARRAGHGLAQGRHRRGGDDQASQGRPRHRGQGAHPGHAGAEGHHRQRSGGSARAARGDRRQDGAGPASGSLATGAARPRPPPQPRPACAPSPDAGSTSTPRSGRTTPISAG